MKKEDVQDVLNEITQRVITHCAANYDEYKLISSDIESISERVYELLIKRDVDLGNVDPKIFDKYDEHTFDCTVPIKSIDKSLKGVALKKTLERRIAEYLTEQLISELHLPITPAVPEEKQMQEMEKRSEEQLKDYAYAYLNELYKKIMSTSLDVDEDQLFDIINRLFELFKQAGLSASKYKELYNRIVLASDEHMKTMLEYVNKIMLDYYNGKIDIHTAIDKVLTTLGIQDHVLVRAEKEFTEQMTRSKQEKSIEGTETEEEKQVPSGPTITSKEQLKSLIKREKPVLVLAYKLNGKLYIIINRTVYLVTDDEVYKLIGKTIDEVLEEQFEQKAAIGVVFMCTVKNDHVDLDVLSGFLIFDGRKMSKLWHINALLANANEDYKQCIFVAGNNVYVYDNCNLTHEDEGSIYSLSRDGYKLVKRSIQG